MLHHSTHSDDSLRYLALRRKQKRKKTPPEYKTRPHFKWMEQQIFFESFLDTS